MNNQTKWIVGIIVVLLVIAGIWWAMQPAAPANPNGGFETPAGSTDTRQQPTVENRSSSTVAEVVAGLSGTSQYDALFSSTGVGASLSGKGPYTVFVSSDAGFNLLPAGTISNMTAAQKKRFIQYSIVSGKMLDIDAVNSGSVQALSGDALNFTVQKDSKLVQVNSSFALYAYKTKNGIVYVLNQPLLPPLK